MNGENGYIKLHRKILQWEWFSNVNALAVFIYCLLSANYKPCRWQGIEIQAGQFVTSTKSIGKAIHLSAQSVRTSLIHLKSTGEITIKSTNKYSVVTITNWALYQSDEDKLTSATTDKTTNEQQTTNKQLTTNKNIKKDKNNIPPIIPPSIDVGVQSAIAEFVKYRKSIKKPMTEHAVDLLVKKLETMSPDPQTQIAILNQSVMNGWTGIFELKQETKPDVTPRYKRIRE